MRLWHKDLIPVLPRQQLLGQWRECCLISKNIVQNGSPNHLIVNRVMHFPMNHFATYCRLVYSEMLRRGFHPEWGKMDSYFTDLPEVDPAELFSGWHNNRYLRQCFSNLQEKFDCGGIPIGEWAAICYALKGVDLK